ncbi:Bardet-Biedl syndrome 2 protein-like isoform X1 [Daphnia carinata]|uniref:Bardet-Biedl syndrome 2 protein-like isoform X1 n=1 Tax=Daphnia carinata TaxID=120202 RepID=UPI002579D73C|nr:Bardet-Biedl syndrome 2 protein-like isoform X1 [Daphnia carinata]
MLTLVNVIELNLSVFPGQLTICKFKENADTGITSSYVGATSANKVFVRHTNPVQQDQIQYLNIDQRITALCNHPVYHAAVVIGTTSHLLVYDIAENRTMMSKEIENGVGAVLIGSFNEEGEINVIIGGNCFLQCLNMEGNERYWNVMSDQVSALALFDSDGDGHNHLIAGTDDGNLRLFKNGRMTSEIKETDAVTYLTALTDHCFGYALANGTVGVYHKRNRLWRIKSKNHIVALASFDVDNDGHPELVCGWSHGRFDARHWQTGEVVFKEKLDAQHSIAALVVDDWLQMGHAQLIVCSQLGQVWSYLPSDLESTSLDRIKDEYATQAEEEAIRLLLIGKQNLLAELEHIRQSGPSTEVADEEMHLTLTHNQENVLLQLEGGGMINAVIVFAEGLFANGESHALHYDPPRTSVGIPLPVQRNLAVDLHVNAIFGSPNSELLKVVEIVHPLPTFSRFKSVSWSSAENPSALQFRITARLQERIQRIGFWIAQNFIVSPELLNSDTSIELAFEVLPWRTPLTMIFRNEGSFLIESDRLDHVSELIQHLAKFFNVQHLGTEIEIRDDHRKELLELMEGVRGYQAIRQRLTVDMADQVNEIRNWYNESENARLMNDMVEMKRCYAAILSGNQQLVDQQNIRDSNYSELMKRLKQINLHVQHSSNCRVGKYQTDVIQASRQAIKAEDFEQLIKITLHGIENP